MTRMACSTDSRAHTIILLLALCAGANGCTEGETLIGAGFGGIGNSEQSGGKASRGGSTGSGHGGAHTGGDSAGGASAGGASAGGSGQGGNGTCECPDEPITWFTDVDRLGTPMQAVLDCAGFRRVTRADGQGCELPNDRCYPDWQPELDRVLSLLALPEMVTIREAAHASSPLVFGVDQRPVDGAAFVIQFGSDQVVVGDPCTATSSNCQEIPQPLDALTQTLRSLERRAAMECSPECLPTAPVETALGQTGAAPCLGAGYFWIYGRCVKDEGHRSCDESYATEAECVDAHQHCAGLYDTACGGFRVGACADDEYCAYRQDGACGITDGGAVCLPKPRACPENADAPVCGCDGKTYPSLCDAALNGTGELLPHACN